MMYRHGPNGWGIAFRVLSMVAIWGLVIAGVLPPMRWPRSDRRAPARRLRRMTHDESSPSYARGEIDEAEYRQRLKVLGG
jgi:putative membrane protein